MIKEKKQILSHYNQSLEYVHTLTNLTEEQWRTPVSPGKWTIAEVIGHLVPWDLFVLNQRLPFLVNNLPLPQSPHTNLFNSLAAAEARNLSKEEVITAFIESRSSLIHSVDQLTDDLWCREYLFGSASLSLFQYFSGLAEHDEHHFDQIRKIYSII